MSGSPKRELPKMQHLYRAIAGHCLLRVASWPAPKLKTRLLCEQSLYSEARRFCGGFRFSFAVGQNMVGTFLGINATLL